jgi:hypothetical protein
MFQNVGGIVVIGTHSRGNITAGEHIRNGFGRDVPFMVVTDLPSLDQLGGEVINDGDWKLARGRFGFQVNEAVGIGKLTYLG